MKLGFFNSLGKPMGLGAGILGGGGANPLIAGVACPTITPTLVAVTVNNAGFEGTYENEGAGLDFAPNWSNSGMDAGSDVAAKETTIVHGGSASQHITVNAVNEGLQSDAALLLANLWHQLSAWFYPVSGTPRIFEGTASIIAPSTGTGAWENPKGTGRIGAGAARQIFIRTLGAAEFYVDDVEAYTITLASMLVKVGSLVGSSYICSPTVAVNMQAGMAISYLNATNFVLAYVDRATGNAKLDKYIAGTWTNVISGAITYSAAAALRVTVSGTTYSLYYNGAQVGTSQTISDSLGSDVYGFSTSASNSVGTITVNP